MSTAISELFRSASPTKEAFFEGSALFAPFYSPESDRSLEILVRPLSLSQGPLPLPLIELNDVVATTTDRHDPVEALT